MQKVNVSKARLEGILTENRAKYIEAANEHKEASRLKAIKLLEREIYRLEKGGDAQRLINFEFVESDHTHDYDDALGMLEHEVGDAVTLSAQEYRQLVKNEWHWVGEFSGKFNAMTGKAYS